MPSNGLNFLPKSCYFLIPLQFLQQVPFSSASLGTVGLLLQTLLSQISVTANFKREHTSFIRLLSDIHFGTNLKALNAFKTFFIFFILNNQYNLAIRMDLALIVKHLHHKKKGHFENSLPS